MAQRYPRERYEIIIVDGFSSDKTIEIAQKYPVKILYNKEGIAEARNVGVSHAKGSIIAFVDADNQLPRTDWLQLMIKPLLLDPKVAGSLPILTPNKNYPAISRIFSLMQADPLIVFAYGSGLEVKNGFVTEENYFPMSVCVIWRKLLTGCYSFKKTLLRSEDVDVTYRLIKQGYKFAIVQDAGFYHLYVSSFSDFLKKTFNRIKNFVNRSSNCEFEFVPKNSTKNRFLYNLLFDIVGVGVTIRVVRGIKKDHDLSWLYYPIVLFSILFFYAIAFASSKNGRMLLQSFTGKNSINL